MNDSDNKGIYERAYEAGHRLEGKYRGCAQCAFAALQELLDLRNEQTDAVFKSATALSGGMGNEGDGSCGAYSGSVMMLGYLIGRERDNFEDPEGIRFETIELARQLHDKFIGEYGTVLCHGIHRKIFGRPFYLHDEDEKRKFDEAGAHTEKCTDVVGKAAAWTMEILGNNTQL